jgi:hypothetical protein
LSQPVSLTTTATLKSGVGAYPIAVGGGASPNYSILLKAGVLTVLPAELTVTADPQSKLYGAPLPTLTATYRGFVNGETAASLANPAALATSATVASPVGVYAIRPSGGSSSNYTFKFQPGSLTVTKAPLTIRVDDKIKGLGASLPVFTATYMGFVNGDTAASLTQPVSFATTATQSSPLGRYPIIGSGAAALNYNLIFVNGTLTVTDAIQPPVFAASALQRGTDGSVAIELFVGPNSTIRLEAAADLMTWHEVASQTSADGHVLFKMSGASPGNWQFYRAVLLR